MLRCFWHHLQLLKWISENIFRNFKTLGPQFLEKSFLSLPQSDINFLSQFTKFESTRAKSGLRNVLIRVRSCDSSTFTRCTPILIWGFSKESAKKSKFLVHLDHFSKYLRNFEKWSASYKCWTDATPYSGWKAWFHIKAANLNFLTAFDIYIFVSEKW